LTLHPDVSRDICWHYTLMYHVTFVDTKPWCITWHLLTLHRDVSRDICWHYSLMFYVTFVDTTPWCFTWHLLTLHPDVSRDICWHYTVMFHVTLRTEACKRSLRPLLHLFEVILMKLLQQQSRDHFKHCRRRAARVQHVSN